MNVNDRDQMLQGTTLSHYEPVMWAAPVKASELQTSGAQVISEQLQNVALTPGMTSTQQNQDNVSS
jgi:CHASE1-domain containing sensor protein